MSLKEWILSRTPSAYRQRLIDLKNSLWGGYRQCHYSQFGEDIVLQSLLPHSTGFYVDVGANHPKRYSNTYLLYKRGWRGINIEPNAEAVALFNKTRTRDTNLCMGVAHKESTLHYYRFSDPAFNTFSSEAAKELASKKWLTELPGIEVPVSQLSSILKQHLPHGVTVDLLTVDAEGCDLEVLESNDWLQYKPKVVAIESHDFEFANAKENKIYNFLLQQGYQLKSKAGPTLIFSRHNM